jgi:transposase
MTIILDNASFHKGEDIELLIEKSGNKIKYLPPYTILT